MLVANDAGAARAILDSDLESVRDLRALLLEERAALTARDPGALDRVVQLKLDRLQRMQCNELARQRLLGRCRHTEWTTLLGTLDPALDATWQALRTLLEEVADLGRTNERIVARMQRGSSRLLALLRGQDGMSGIYDSKGQTHPGTEPQGGIRA